MRDPDVEDLLRQLAPQVLGAVVRRYGHFDTAEDATQEALLAAAMQWPTGGIPDNPRGWLITVASRRLTDLLRSEQARQRREDGVARWTLPEQRLAPAADRPAAESDDTLSLLFMCCHPVLSPASQNALPLRAGGGLTTAEIARAFLVPETTMTRRISRAKQRVKESGVPFAMPPGGERGQRLGAVLHVLYLVFNEGYTSTSGPSLHRGELSAEAIRLARMVPRLLPGDAEAAGLLALMLLTDARRAARLDADGVMVTLADQDRALWDRELVAEGHALVRECLRRNRPGHYQLLAAVNAVHTDAPTAEATDWGQVLALYDQLYAVTPTPVVALNRAVALAEVQGPGAALELVDRLDLARYHPFHATRADLLRRLGRTAEAADAYHRALDLATNPAERAFLTRRRDGLR